MDILTIISYVLCVSVVKATDCLFPVEWRGLWYDSRLKNIEIKGNSISRKGTCLQRDGNKFLLLNRGTGNRKCFKCLVFTPWHRNLLQYKESPCWHDESLENMCKEITGDIPLHTLVKEQSIPIPCPFQGTYTFSYTNGSVECVNPLSEIRSCADESKFRFVYRRCHGIPGSSNQELDFKCLATWESGEKFMYGKFSQPGTALDSGAYRCFMHSFYGTTGDMSMSADATCQGLQSPSLGVLTMKLSKEMGQRNRGSCQFPNFLIHQEKWRDLSGLYSLDIEDGLKVIRLRDRIRSNSFTYMETTGSSVTKVVYRCLQSMEQTVYGNIDIVTAEYIAYVTTDECVSERKCLLFKKRSNDIIELMIGGTLNDTHNDCHYENAEKHLFLPEVSRVHRCPTELTGIYQYTDKASSCTGAVNFGCLIEEEMLIESTCSENRKSVKIYECLHSWQEESTTYAVVRHSRDSSGSFLCLTFMQTKYGLEVQDSRSCEGDTRVVRNNYLNYLLYDPQVECDSMENTVRQSDQNPPDSGFIDADDDRHSSAQSPSSVTYSVLITATCLLLAFVSR